MHACVSRDLDAASVAVRKVQITSHLLPVPVVMHSIDFQHVRLSLTPQYHAVANTLTPRYNDSLLPPVPQHQEGKPTPRTCSFTANPKDPDLCSGISNPGYVGTVD